jgi:hypothetical protein
LSGGFLPGPNQIARAIYFGRPMPTRPCARKMAKIADFSDDSGSNIRDA